MHYKQINKSIRINWIWFADEFKCCYLIYCLLQYFTKESVNKSNWNVQNGNFSVKNCFLEYNTKLASVCTIFYLTLLAQMYSFVCYFVPHHHHQYNIYKCRFPLDTILFPLSYSLQIDQFPVLLHSQTLFLTSGGSALIRGLSRSSLDNKAGLTNPIFWLSFDLSYFSLT